MNKLNKFLLISTILIGSIQITKADVINAAPSATPGIPTNAQGTFANRPTSPVTGQQYLATDLSNTVIFYDGAKWKPISGNAVIAQMWGLSGTAIVTGTTAETNLATISLPAGFMSANGGLRTTLLSSTNAGTTNLKTVNARLSTSSGVSGSGFISLGNSSSSSTGSAIMIPFYNQNNTSVQRAIGTGIPSYGTSGVISMAVATASPIFINITGTLAVGTDSISLYGYSVEWMEP